MKTGVGGATMITPSHSPPKTALHQFWERRGGYIAGYGYTLANATWLVFGLASLSAREFAAGAINLAGGLGRGAWSDDTVLGLRNFGNKIGASAGLISQLVSTWPGVMSLDPWIIGANVIIGAAQIIDFRSGRHKALYGDHANPLLRATLGRSRRLAGCTRALSRLPVIYAHLTVGNMLAAGVFGLLCLADLVYAGSQPCAEPAADSPR